MDLAVATRLSTGVSGLDGILNGGLQPGRVFLLEGKPGTGKTTMALQFLLAGRDRGERGLYITLSESRQELAEVEQAHGWSLDGIEICELVSDDGLDPEQQQSVLHPAELELGETTRLVMQRVDEIRPARLVFDSLSELRLLAQSTLRYRRQILALKQFFTQRSCAVLLLDDLSSEKDDVQLHSICHGVLLLEQMLLDYGCERRRLRVLKLRGSTFRGGWHDYSIEHGGVIAYPRLFSHKEAVVVGAPVSSGSSGLDELLGGGLVPGSNTLLIGPSGVGKTSTATSAVMAGLQRGERAAYFLFDEGLPSLLARSKGLGLDLRPYLDSGQLMIREIDPAELSPGEFAVAVQRQVEQSNVKIIVIDSLNAYLQSMPGEKYLVLQMHELLSFLNQNGVVTLLVLAQHGLIGSVSSAIDISYLSDNVVLLRFFEVAGEVRKAISVLKTRTLRHQRTVREFMLGEHGVEVGGALRGFSGVLSGSPEWHGDQADLMVEQAPGSSVPT